MGTNSKNKLLAKDSDMDNLQEATVFSLCLLLISCIFLAAILSRFKRKPHLPPCPLALPVIGHLHLLRGVLHQAFHKLSNRYGPLIHLHLGYKLAVVVSSPEIAKEFLKDKESFFLNHPKTVNLEYITYGTSDFAMAPYGPYWKFIKKLCMTQLLGGRALERYLPIRHQEVKRSLEVILRKANASESVDLGKELRKLANNVVSRMAFRRRCFEEDDEADEAIGLVKELLELSGEFNVADLFWFCRNLDLQGFEKRLKDVRDRFDGMMERIIKEHREAREEKLSGEAQVKDLLDILLDIFEDESSQTRLTRENINAFFLNIFEAGTDTSSLTAEWALAELINHPSVMEKARKEIDSVVGKSRLVEESDIPNLPYLQAIVKETLRLHPASPLVARESREDCKVAGYDIPAKTLLLVNVWALGRDPKHWEDSLEFKPERFVTEQGSERVKVELRGQQFHMLPFGSGRRSCPGASLALQIVQTSVAAMIQCFEWNLCGEDGAVDMEEGAGITLSRANPFICKPVPRLDPFPSFS